MQAAAADRAFSGPNGAGERGNASYAATNRRILWQNMTGTEHADPFRRLSEAFAAMARNTGLYPGALAIRSGATVEATRRMGAWSAEAPPDAGDIAKLLAFFGIADQPLERWLPMPGK